MKITFVSVILLLIIGVKGYAEINPYASQPNNSNVETSGYMKDKQKDNKKHKKVNNYTYAYVGVWNFVTNAPEIGVVYKNFDLSFSGFGVGKKGDSMHYYNIIESDHNTYMFTFNYRVYNFVSNSGRHILTPYIGVGIGNDKYTTTDYNKTPYSEITTNDNLFLFSLGVDYTYKISTHNALSLKVGYPTAGLAYKFIF